MPDPLALTGVHIRACAVRVIVRDDTPASEALFALLRAEKPRWTLPQWQAVLAELDSSNLTLADWLAARADWL